jgi:hypothetical protein
MPKILRGLGSKGLPCGCLVGVYQTYTNETVAILDAKGSQCSDDSHRLDSNVQMAVIDFQNQEPRTMPTVNR